MIAPSDFKKGGGEWEFFDLPEQWCIHYKELTFHLKPFSFKHTGLFPELRAESQTAAWRLPQGANIPLLCCWGDLSGHTVLSM